MSVCARCRQEHVCLVQFYARRRKFVAHGWLTGRHRQRHWPGRASTVARARCESAKTPRRACGTAGPLAELVCLVRREPRCPTLMLVGIGLAGPRGVKPQAARRAGYDCCGRSWPRAWASAEHARLRSLPAASGAKRRLTATTRKESTSCPRNLATTSTTGQSWPSPASDTSLRTTPRWTWRKQTFGPMAIALVTCRRLVPHALATVLRSDIHRPQPSPATTDPAAVER